MLLNAGQAVRESLFFGWQRLSFCRSRILLSATDGGDSMPPIRGESADPDVVICSFL